MKLFPEKLNTFSKLAQQGSVGSIDDGDPESKNISQRKNIGWQPPPEQNGSENTMTVFFLHLFNVDFFPR